MQTFKPVVLPMLPGGLRARAENVPTMADVMAAVRELSATHEKFREKNNESIEALKRGRDDVVAREHVDRINADVTKLTDNIEAMRAQLAAVTVTGGGTTERGQTPEARAHSQAFRAFLARGIESDLNALAVRAQLTSDSNPDGGFVVPVEMDLTIQRVLGTISALRRLANVQTITTASLREIHDLAGTGSGWVGEQDTRSETNTPTLAQLQFDAMEMYAQPQASSTLLDDAAVNVESWVAEAVATAFAELEAAAFVSGDGVKKPRGILSYTKVANASYAPSTAAGWAKTGYIATGLSAGFVATTASASGYDNLIDLQHALRSQMMPGAAWLMSRATLAAVRKIRDETTGHYAYSPPTAGEPGSILGHTVEIDDNMPAIAANSYSIAFANWQRAYKVVDRFGTRVLRDPFTNKPFVKFYTTRRVGGGIRDFEAIKLMKFAAS